MYISSNYFLCTLPYIRRDIFSRPDRTERKETMKHILIRAKQYRSQASGAELGALNYILENPSAIPNLTIKQLSERSYSSPSTIVRLCRKLGFDGYRDAQQSLLHDLAIRKEDEKAAAQGAKVPLSGSTGEIMEHITYRNIASLEDSLKLVDEEAVEKAVDCICGASSVLLFGLGASQLVAQDAYLKFLRIDKPCFCCSDIHSQYVLAKNAKSSDVAIIISYSGCTAEIVRCSEYLAAQGTPIIAITRFESSPIAQLATQCLYVVATEDLYRTGAMSSRISQLNMIDILYTSCFNRNIAENTKHFSHNRIVK